MKKYILTESQVKGLVKNLINEDVQDVNFLKLKDLAELVSRMGMEKETLLKIFIDMYRNEGTEGVIKLFNSATNLDLEDFGYGRFRVKQ